MWALKKTAIFAGFVVLQVLVVHAFEVEDDVYIKNGSETHKMSSKLSSQVILHGFLLWVSMGFLMPIGVLIIRMSSIEQCNKRLKVLFHYHVIVQVLSISLATAGAILSIKNFDNSFNNNHQKVGVGLYGIIWMQAVIGCFRPKRGSKQRSMWFFLHWLTGTAITLLGVINVYTGLHAYHKRASKNVNLWSILFTVEVCFLVFIYLLQDKWLYMKKQGVVPVPANEPTKCTNEVNGTNKDLEQQRRPHQVASEATVYK